MRFVWVLLLFGQLCGVARFDVGPEAYWMRRLREGGAMQEGAIYGVRGLAERIKRRAMYLGLEGHYGRGRIRGHTATGRGTTSQMLVEEFEARIGYTFQYGSKVRPWVAPYLSYGHVWMTNDFDPPTPLPVIIRDKYEYVGVGFRSGVVLGRCWSVGLNFQFKFMFNAESRVTDDPFAGNQTLMVDDEPAYEVEIPIMWCRGWYELNVVPFYRYRELGGREAVPFDFVATKYHMAGARVTMAVRF